VNNCILLFRVWGLGILYWLWSRAHNLRFGVWADADLGFMNFRMAPMSRQPKMKLIVATMLQ
jgi:hypothetical protein